MEIQDIMEVQEEHHSTDMEAVEEKKLMDLANLMEEIETLPQILLAKKLKINISVTY